MLGGSARHYADNFLPEIVFRDFMPIGEFRYAATKGWFAVNSWTGRFEDASTDSNVVAFICKGAARLVHGQRQIRFSPNLLNKTRMPFGYFLEAIGRMKRHAEPLWASGFSATSDCHQMAAINE
jgi:hypothetical protein